ncbi:hypothetical protein BGW36DRAFT_306760 [Talaromyces proteolyticus]|uniref:Uncharacterized protein n=1 Tax=Talaromyces proteolyticus TaxID=1131652 RepID=A0AAD4PVH8_9EURO|nr:uncharacterized protein BGW36DRAFT_306760 [Talaromyces proteolyticus]KAH8690713.1 hypothetical protein BGW36DRAFT_306760 [Talaromyces proteolyticus]
MAGFVQAIGIINGLLGIVQFGINNFESQPPPGSTIKFAIGLDSQSGLTNAGGDLPDVRIWNLYGKFVGMTDDPGSVGDGDIGQVYVSHENQGVYSLMSANDDAICIAWASTTWSAERGGNKYAVSGDFGRECGGTWYHSGMFPYDNSQYQPDCFWIDANGDQPNTGFQVRWPSYAGVKFNESSKDPGKFCNGIDFGLRTEKDPSSITYYTNPTKRETPSTPKRVSWAASRLVVSDSASHSAKRLCESETSMGPDFAHIDEQLFCDMGTKTLYSFCNNGKKTDCFNMDTQKLATAQGTRISASTRSPYSTVVDWRKGGKA